jgi:crotonobetainyl-CoA:carnitine CoA-transferase CaiB-like acyl-CoA transferase
MPTILPESPPLADLVVVDLTRALAGPYCTLMLADMGARVIKVEPPGSGDHTRSWGPPFIGGESVYFLSVNRNKESVTLDFSRPEAREVLQRLIAGADVLVENFRPGTLDPFGLDYGTLAAEHPRLIYASISGFGQTGPRRAEPGYDAVIQAEGGLMSLTGAPDGQAFRPGVAVADLVSGLMAAHGILLALIARERTGRGQQVDLSMLDAVSSILAYQAGLAFAGETPRRVGNRHPTIAPYDSFATTDGAIFVAAGTDTHFRALCDVLDLPSAAADPRYASNAGRVEHYQELRRTLAARLKERPRAEWKQALTKAGVPAGVVRDVREALEDPQLVDRQMLLDVEHPTAGRVRQLGIPVKLSATPGSVRRPPPRLGEHTDSVLAEFGLTQPQIAALRETRTI